MFYIVGEQLQINQPNVYDCGVPASLASLVPALADVCNNSQGQMAYSSLPHTQPASNRSVPLTSLGGTEFISFAKGRSFNNGKEQFRNYSFVIFLTVEVLFHG